MPSKLPSDLPPKLSKLARLRADESDKRRVFRTLVRGSGRAAALIAAAMIDNTLEDAIISEFDSELTDKELNELFLPGQGSEPPLSTLGAKIKIGYALGIYGPVTRGDLLTISKIRNIFAHSPKALDFSHPSIAQVCRGLQVPTAYAAKSITTGKDLKNADAHPRNAFLLACYSIEISLLRHTATTYTRKAQAIGALHEQIESGKMAADEVNQIFKGVQPRRPP